MIVKILVSVLAASIMITAEPIREKRQLAFPGANFNPFLMASFGEMDMWARPCGRNASPMDRNYIMSQEFEAGQPFGFVPCQCVPFGSCESTWTPTMSQECNPGATSPGPLNPMPPIVCCCGSKRK